MLHKASVGFIGRRQKTAKALCCNIVKVAQIATDADTDCPHCLKAIADEAAGYERAIEAAERAGLDTRELRASFERWSTVRYRTPFFF